MDDRELRKHFEQFGAVQERKSGLNMFVFRFRYPPTNYDRGKMVFQDPSVRLHVNWERVTPNWWFGLVWIWEKTPLVPCP